MLLGFAVTQHCNLRCPHCIRDDITTVRSLEVGFIRSVLDQALELFGTVGASLTGGEPLLHPQFSEMVALFAERRVPYCFVSNGWHLARVLPVLEHYAPEFVRLSLSGATAAVHDAERGRGSFRRVLLAVALLTSRRIPASLSLVVDKRDRHQLKEAADLAEALGCVDLHFILPQPVPGSAARDTDLPPEGWMPVRREVEALAREPGRRTRIRLDYGVPSDGPEERCDTKRLRRLYVDAHGRLCTCCQLSDYGNNEAEAVADLREMPLAEAWGLYQERMRELEAKSAPDPDAADPFARFPCIRCARSCGKLQWLQGFPQSPWTGAADARMEHAAGRPLVALSRSPRRVGSASS